jgi:hypothetical protein
MSFLIWPKKIIVYSFQAITFIGLITNTILFVLFSRKRFQNTIIKTYLRMFIVFQTLNLILPRIKIFELNLNKYFICSLRFFYKNFHFSNAAWLLVVISIHRYLSISYPKQFLFRKKHLFQTILCCFIFVFKSWFYYLKDFETNQTNKTKSTYKCPNQH